MTIRPLQHADIPRVRALDTEAFGDLFARLTGKPFDMTIREEEAAGRAQPTIAVAVY